MNLQRAVADLAAQTSTPPHYLLDDDPGLRHNYTKRVEAERNEADKAGLPPLDKARRVWNMPTNGGDR